MIIRRIDDLGRIAIPKEIRCNLHMEIGESVEIQVHKNGEIILKKYKKSWEDTVLEWWKKHHSLPAMQDTNFYRMGDYTFCIIRYPDNSTIAGFAKRYCKDTHNDIIGKVAAYARALGQSINELIGWEG